MIALNEQDMEKALESKTHRTCNKKLSGIQEDRQRFWVIELKKGCL